MFECLLRNILIPLSPWPYTDKYRQKETLVNRSCN